MFQNFFVGSAVAHVGYLGLQAFHTYFPHQSPAVSSSSEAYKTQLKELNKTAQEVAKDVGYPNPKSIKVSRSKNEIYAFHSFGTRSSGVLSVSSSILEQIPSLPMKVENLAYEKLYNQLVKNCPLVSGEVSAYVNETEAKNKEKIISNIGPLHSKLNKEEIKAVFGHEIQHLCDNVCIKQLKNSLIASLVSVLGSSIVLHTRQSVPGAILFQLSTYLIVRFAFQFMNKEHEQKADQTARLVSESGARSLAKRELVARELFSGMPKSLSQKIQLYLLNLYEGCSYEGVASRYSHLNSEV